MSLASKLQALVDGLEYTRQAIEGKGATLPAGSPLGDFPIAVESIESESWVDPPTSSDLGDNAYGMFANWHWLKRVGPFDTSSVESMDFLFAGCVSLEEIPTPFDTSSLEYAYQMFYMCVSLTEIELSDCSNIIDASGMFGDPPDLGVGLTSLERLILPGMTIGFDLYDTQMSATALNDLFHSLGTASGSQTITITGAPGAATCDRTIATAKGWTITG